MKTLVYPIAIEAGDAAHAYGVVVPDLPGCFSAGDTLEEAYVNAREAIASHIEVLIDEGMQIPERGSLEEHRKDPAYAGWLWGLVEVPNIPAMRKSVRINISLPEALVEEIDDYVREHHLTRSGFLARAASNAIEQAQQ
jgi:predicted RNase H-like HicB family nuclease